MRESKISVSAELKYSLMKVKNCVYECRLHHHHHHRGGGGPLVAALHNYIAYHPLTKKPTLSPSSYTTSVKEKRRRSNPSRRANHPRVIPIPHCFYLYIYNTRRRHRRTKLPTFAFIFFAFPGQASKRMLSFKT